MITVHRIFDYHPPQLRGPFQAESNDSAFWLKIYGRSLKGSLDLEFYLTFGPTAIDLGVTPYPICKGQRLHTYEDSIKMVTDKKVSRRLFRTLDSVVRKQKRVHLTEEEWLNIFCHISHLKHKEWNVERLLSKSVTGATDWEGSVIVKRNLYGEIK